jgi:anthranilate phosphoribosyltransferase
MLPELTSEIVSGKVLDQTRCADALQHIFSDETCEDISIASFLSAISTRGVTALELAGFATTMRENAARVDYGHTNLVDTAGTGGGIDSFNVSTTAAFVIAAAGFPVAKHGNRAMTSKCGSADVLESLGVNIATTLSASRKVMDKAGISFMFAPHHHPAMKRVVGIRKKLKHRTIFNMLGPLTNPAGARIQLIGAYSVETARVMAEALSLLNPHRAWVFHSDDGMDELSPFVASQVFEIGPGEVRQFAFDPAEHIEITGSVSDLAGGSADENAATTRNILAGKAANQASLNIVLLNAAAAIHLASGESFADSLKIAAQQIRNGKALDVLKTLVEVSNA